MPSRSSARPVLTMIALAVKRHARSYRCLGPVTSRSLLAMDLAEGLDKDPADIRCLILELTAWADHYEAVADKAGPSGSREDGAAGSHSTDPSARVPA